jgi:hypothetical protein
MPQASPVPSEPWHGRNYAGSRDRQRHAVTWAHDARVTSVSRKERVGRPIPSVPGPDRESRARRASQLPANAEWALVQQGEKQNELEVQQNTEILELSRQILELAQEIRTLQQQRSTP